MLDQIRRPRVQHFGKPEDRSNRWTLQSSLKEADKCSVNTAFKSKVLLGDAE